MNRIKDSKVVNFGIPSDHSTIQLNLKLKNSKKILDFLIYPTL